MRTKIIFLFAALIGTLSSQAQVTLTGTSYTQNFGALGSGLPAGWSVYSSATASTFGSAETFTATTTAWSTATADTEFRNISSNTGVVWGANSATQNGNTNRALGWRPLDAASRNGAIMLTLANTAGLSAFNLCFSLFVANDVGGSQNYDVEYRIGNTGAFTKLGSTFATPDSGSATFTVSNYSFDSVTLGSWANQSSSIYLRIRGTSTSGSGSLDTIGLDNFQLSYTAVPEIEEGSALAGLAALLWAAVRRARHTKSPAA
jgi:trimeric autotransporter adhesin